MEKLWSCQSFSKLKLDIFLFIYSSVPNRRLFQISIQNRNCLKIFSSVQTGFFSESIKHTDRKLLFMGVYIIFLRFFEKMVPKNTDQIFSWKIIKHIVPNKTCRLWKNYQKNKLAGSSIRDTRVSKIVLNIVSPNHNIFIHILCNRFIRFWVLTIM